MEVSHQPKKSLSMAAGRLMLQQNSCRHWGQQIEDTMLLALLHPDVYENIAKGTRRHPSNNKPRAVLFEGPPGTGKTTSARSVYHSCLSDFHSTARLTDSIKTQQDYALD